MLHARRVRLGSGGGVFALLVRVYVGWWGGWVGRVRRRRGVLSFCWSRGGRQACAGGHMGLTTSGEAIVCSLDARTTHSNLDTGGRNGHGRKEEDSSSTR